MNINYLKKVFYIIRNYKFPKFTKKLNKLAIQFRNFIRKEIF
jgi:hypothetical protein